MSLLRDSKDIPTSLTVGGGRVTGPRVDETRPAIIRALLKCTRHRVSGHHAADTGARTRRAAQTPRQSRASEQR